VVKVRVAEPEFVRVTDWAELVTPTPSPVKVSEVGERVTAGAPVAVGLLEPPPQPAKMANPTVTSKRPLRVMIG
jgi:hypothetical protein